MELLTLFFWILPYAEQEIEAVISELCRRHLLAEDVMAVCETDKNIQLPEEIAELGIWKEKYMELVR